jgi:hypothetical protein
VHSVPPPALPASHAPLPPPPQRKEARPLSHALNNRLIQYLDSSAHGFGPEVALNWLFPYPRITPPPQREHQPVPYCACSVLNPRGAGASCVDLLTERRAELTDSGRSEWREWVGWCVFSSSLPYCFSPSVELRTGKAHRGLGVCAWCVCGGQPVRARAVQRVQSERGLAVPRYPARYAHHEVRPYVLPIEQSNVVGDHAHKFNFQSRIDRSVEAWRALRRGMISFDIASICSHELGQSDLQLGCSGEPVPTVSDGTPSAPYVVPSTDVTQEDRILELEDQLVKVRRSWVGYFTATCPAPHPLLETLAALPAISTPQ